MNAIEEQSSSVGDGTFEEIFGDDEEYAGLGTCANDEDFGLVRMKLGLDPKIGWGPYYSYAEDDEMDSDSD